MASLSFMQFLPGQRDNYLAQVTAAYPELSSRFRRVIGRRPPTDEDQRPIRALFERTCERLGLEPIGDTLRVDPAIPDEIRTLALHDIPGRWGRMDAVAEG